LASLRADPKFAPVADVLERRLAPKIGRDRAIVDALDRFAMSPREFGLQWRRYERSAWLREKAFARCPDRYLGRVEGSFWRLLSAGWPALSDDRLERIARHLRRRAKSAYQE
jgi:hypothetical protein